MLLSRYDLILMTKEYFDIQSDCKLDFLEKFEIVDNRIMNSKIDNKLYRTINYKLKIIITD